MVNKNKALVVFQNKKIRRKWFNDEWYFSIVDIIAVLTDNDYQKARKYWNKLAQRMRDEGNQTVTNCHQLKMTAKDGRMRLTDAASPEILLRLIQSVPSPKAEPIKL